MQTNDCVITALGPGQINDLLFVYYGGTAGQNLQDAEYAWLISKGATPANVNDMWFEVLATAGYTGSLEDMQNEFW